MYTFDQGTMTDDEFLSDLYAQYMQSCKTETTHGCNVTYSTKVYFNVKVSVIDLEELRQPL